MFPVVDKEQGYQWIYRALRTAPLLVRDLPEAPAFDRSLFAGSETLEPINQEQKLGHQFECALAHLIVASPKLELIARNVQVPRADGSTLGELDFVIKETESGKYIHLELAIKFYLGVFRNGCWAFPGPDPRDNWSSKLERMRRHQLQMIRNPQAKDLLRDRFGIDSIETQQLIYGRLFEPIKKGAVCHPQYIANEALRGFWLSGDAWDAVFPSVKKVYVIPKKFWPIRMRLEYQDHLEAVSVSELRSRARERCIMFVLPETAQIGFLVPDDWPDIH